MNLPDTENANYLFAFKKGYRSAQEGKALHQAPSTLKQDAALREYFQQGWQNFHDEMAEAGQDSTVSPWRARASWAIMAIIAGIGTASLIIHKMEQEQQGHAPLISITPPSKMVQTPSTEPTIPEEMGQDAFSSAFMEDDLTRLARNLEPNTPEELALISESTDLEPMALETNSSTLSLPSEGAQDVDQPPEASIESLTAPHQTSSTDPEVVPPPASVTESLSILSPEARHDLELNKLEAEQAQAPETRSQPIQESDITIIEATFTNEIVNRQAGTVFDSTIPKSVRKLYFFTQVGNAKDQKIYHRWLYQGREMAKVGLTIRSNRYRTWSAKTLTSAWSGEWQVEVLNANDEVIFRQKFNYIK